MSPEIYWVVWLAGPDRFALSMVGLQGDSLRIRGRGRVDDQGLSHF